MSKQETEKNEENSVKYIKKVQPEAKTRSTESKDENKKAPVQINTGLQCPPKF